MAIHVVKNVTGLSAAIKAAKSGDTIAMESGNYGSLTLDSRNAKDGISFVSVNESKPAVFSAVKVDGLSSISFEGITFKGALKGGYGSGTGLQVTGSTNVKVEDCDFVDLLTGALFHGHSKNIKIVDSELKGISGDAIRFSTVNGGLAEGNKISMKALPGLEHKDMIQVANGGSNITLRANVMTASDGMTHAIYMGNVKAKVSLDHADFYKNILVEDNIILGGQRHGISVGEVDGLVVRGNVVLQHPDVTSSKAVYTPVILVAKDALNVTIEDNVTHGKPSAADINWMNVSTPTKWSIADNKIVSVDATVQKVLGYDPFKEGASKPVTSGPSESDFDAPTSPVVSPERPTEPGDKVVIVKADTKTEWKSVDADFADGDTIVFQNFGPNVFKGTSGGNPLEISRRGDAVRLDSYEDIRELDQASKAVSVRAAGDDLVVRVAQKDGVMKFRLEDMADDYFDLAPIRKASFDFNATAQTSASRKAIDVDFAHGDTIVFRNFVANTFQDVRGGNPLDVGARSASVVIDSVEDLRELVGASASVSARESRGDLFLTVKQPGGAQTFIIDDFADAYFETGQWLV